MIDLRAITRGVLTKFMPGYALGVTALLALGTLTGGIIVGWGSVIQQGVVLSVGYWSALVALRYRLNNTAEVNGRRSLIAGILAPPAALTAMIIFRTDADLGILAVSGLVGGAMAMAMFFPWLKPQSVPALTDDEARALLAESAVDWEGATAGHPEKTDLTRSQ
jgi:hypothetical protein